MQFTVVLQSILFMLAFMALGFVLVKVRASDASHAKTLSALLLYGCTPGIIITSFQEMEYSPDNNMNLLLFFILSLLIQLLLFGLLSLLFRDRMENGKYRILTIGSFMGNTGFFGQPVVMAIFPDRPIAACYCMMASISMNLLVFTLGEYMISRDKKYISAKKAILNPTVFSLAVALPLYFLKIRLPNVPFNVLSALRTMSAPLCMLMLGLRLASMKLREVFAEPLAYMVSALKLLAFPLISYSIVCLIPGLDQTFRTTMLVVAAAPCASIVLALAEKHDCEQKSAAYSVLISSILCVVTLPVLSLIFG